MRIPNLKCTMAPRRTLCGAAALFAMLPLSGCSHAPNFNILGSYFPAWLLCIAVGILLTALVHWGLLRLHVDRYVQPSLVVYPCMAAFFAFTLWLMLFS